VPRPLYLCCCETDSAGGRAAAKRIEALGVTRFSEGVYLTDALGPPARIVEYALAGSRPPVPCIMVVELTEDVLFSTSALPIGAIELIHFRESDR